MVACAMFKTGKYLKAFTFDPITFEISNRLDITLSRVGTGNPNYQNIFQVFDEWLTTHGDNADLYYDGPKFTGEGHIFLNGRRVQIHDLNVDTSHYIKMIMNHQQHHGLNNQYRDTHIKTVRNAVAEGKPALECLIRSANTNEVRMSFSVMRDYYHAQTGKAAKPSYPDTLKSIHAERTWTSVVEFISFMLPKGQRNRLGLSTYQKARSNWAKNSGVYFRKKEDLRAGNINLYNLLEQIYLRAV